MKRICCHLPMFVLPFVLLPLANAQSGVDVAIGFGAAQDKALATGLTTDFSNPNSPTFGQFINCPVSAGGASCSATNSLNSFMMGISGDLMLWNHFGVGAEVAFQPAKQDYAVFGPGTDTALAYGGPFTMQSRMTFYDFNGIFQPVRTKKVALKIEGGIGGANLRFYQSGTTSSALFGGQNFSQYFGSSNHFQVHAGVGVQIYVTEHMFVRPAFDVHYVNNLYQFNRNLVTQETVWLGYTFGGQ